MKWMMLGGITLALIGCMGHARPEWVKNNKEAFLHDRTFYGVGSVSGISDFGMSEMTARDMALSHIRKTLEAFSLALIQEYKNSLTDSALKKAEAAGNMPLFFQTPIAIVLLQVETDDTWTDPDDNMAYILAQLKLRWYVKEVARTNEINPALRAFIKNNASRVFDEFKTKTEAAPLPPLEEAPAVS